MHSSWVQNNTVVAQQTRAFLERMFVEGGEEIPLLASQPLLLSDPKAVYFVESGGVDIFMVDVVKGQPSGRRTHFLRVNKGQLLLGVELLATLSEDKFFGLIACGLPDTRLRYLTKETTRKHAEILRVTDGVNGLVDHWVSNLSIEINENNVPRELLTLDSKGTHTIPAGTAFSATKETLWLYHKSGTLKVAGMTEIQPWKQTVFLPLVRGSWLEAVTDCELIVITSKEFFEKDVNLISLRRFHRICLDCLARFRFVKLEQSEQLIGEKMESEAQSVSDALYSLALFGSEGQVESFTDTTREEGLMKVCHKVGEANGVKIVRPQLSEEEEPNLQEILTASHLRSREILLRRNWWKSSGAAFVAFTEGLELPVAVLPRPSRGYDIYDPLTGSLSQVNQESAGGLEPHAHEIYRPFPRRELKPLDLIKFALKGTYRDVFLILVTGIIAGFIGMLMPLATGQVIDNLIPNARSSLLVQMGLALAIVAFANATISVAQTIASIRIEIRSSSAIQGAVWDRLLGLPVPFFRKYGTKNLAQRTAGIDTIRKALSSSTISLLLSNNFSLMNFFLMLYYDNHLAWINALLGLGSVLNAAIISFSTIYMRRELASLEGQLSSLLLQLLTGIQKIRIASAENRAFGEWAKIFSAKRTLEYQIGNIVNTFDVISTIYPIFSTAVIYFMVVESIRNGKLNTNNFLTFNTSFKIFLSNLLTIIGKIIELFKLLPVYKKTKPILENIPKIHKNYNHPKKLMGNIQLNHITFHYNKDDSPIINNINLTIKKNEFITLIGTTATKKSTLIHLILGFEQPKSKSVYYDDKNLDTLDVSEVRRQFGVVLQNGDLVDGDIFDNIVGNRNMTHDQT